MQLISSICLSLAFLAVSVRGDLHPDCVCTNDGTYNWRMTLKACTVYNDAGYQWGGSTYDTPSGRCDANANSQLGGNEWEAACKSVASSGFQCVDGTGTCFATPDSVRGSCSK
ncbi:hypothetical protein F4809DRAFT_650980 [Biscogniauxia mediterranea]|nr:hypothetical protein F4809DRAFT_650980 [Biscogniauxia mediterranea]